jgi:hypothetical protein
VDFRAAPPPGVDTRALQSAALMQSALQGAGTTGTTTTPPGGTAGTAGTTGATPPNAAQLAIQSVMKPSPGGSIIYFRVD